MGAGGSLTFNHGLFRFVHRTNCIIIAIQIELEYSPRNTQSGDLSMNRKIVSGTALVVVIAGLGAWRWSSSTAQETNLTLLGNVDIRQVSLAFQDSERIVEMRVEEGNKVKAGQVLAVLDSRTLELQAAQSQAQIDVNKKALLRLRNGSRPEEIAQAQARADAADM